MSLWSALTTLMQPMSSPLWSALTTLMQLTSSTRTYQKSLLCLSQSRIVAIAVQRGLNMSHWDFVAKMGKSNWRCQNRLNSSDCCTRGRTPTRNISWTILGGLMVIFRSPHSIVIMTGILQAQEMEFTRLKQTDKFTTIYTPSEHKVMTQATCSYTSMMMILAYHTVLTRSRRVVSSKRLLCHCEFGGNPKRQPLF